MTLKRRRHGTNSERPLSTPAPDSILLVEQQVALEVRSKGSVEVLVPQASTLRTYLVHSQEVPVVVEDVSPLFKRRYLSERISKSRRTSLLWTPRKGLTATSTSLPLYNVVPVKVMV